MPNTMSVQIQANESLQGGSGDQHQYNNVVLMSRGHNITGNATVNADLFPETASGGGSIYYDCAHWYPSMTAPYSGTFKLKVAGSATFNIVQRTTSGGQVEATPLPTRTVTDQTIDVPVSPTVEGCHFRITVSNIVQPITEMALCHSTHYQDYLDGKTFNKDWIAQISRGGGVCRIMKLIRADDWPVYDPSITKAMDSRNFYPRGVIFTPMSQCYYTGLPYSRYCTPYEALIKDASLYGGFTPYLNIRAAEDDATVTAIGQMLAQYDLPMVYIEIGNENFHGPSNGSPHHYWIDEANAKWPASGLSGGKLGRNAFARRASEMFEILEAEHSRAQMKFVSADSGAFTAWVSQTYDAPLWDSTADADGERARYNRWHNGELTDAVALNAYFGNDILKGYNAAPWDMTDINELSTRLKASIDTRCNTMNAVFNAFENRWGVGSIERISYEGGMGFYQKGNVSISTAEQNAAIAAIEADAEMTSIYTYWLNKCQDTSKLAKNLHYADFGRTKWGVIQNVTDDLADSRRGAALSAWIDGTVVPTNTAPVADDATLPAVEDTPLSGNVLNYADDADGDTLTVTANTDPSNGSVSVASNGAFTYTPDNAFTGSDSFTYTVSDGTDSDTGTITLNVVASGGPANNAPVAGNASLSVTEGLELEGNVLNYASDADGDTLTMTANTSPSHGVLNIGPRGKFNYNADQGYTGTDSFTYTASDGTDSDTGTITITIVAAGATGNAPVANDAGFPCDENSTTTRNALFNDSDPDGDTITVDSYTNPSHGTINSFTSAGVFEYEPNTDYVGQDTFSYTITDGNGNYSTATITITVNAVASSNTAPTAQDFSITIEEDNVLEGDVLLDATDPEGDPLTVISNTDPSNGTVVVLVDGTFEYTPDSGYSGSDSFTYTISDGALTDTGTVSITITEAPPVLSDTVEQLRADLAEAIAISNALAEQLATVQARLGGSLIAANRLGDYTLTNINNAS